MVARVGHTATKSWCKCHRIIPKYSMGLPLVKLIEGLTNLLLWLSSITRKMKFLLKRASSGPTLWIVLTGGALRLFLGNYYGTKRGFGVFLASMKTLQSILNQLFISGKWKHNSLTYFLPILNFIFSNDTRIKWVIISHIVKKLVHHLDGGLEITPANGLIL